METEISYLSKKFDKIAIFAVNMRPGETQTRPVPNNVVSYPLNCPHKKAPNILRGLFCFIKGYKKLYPDVRKTLSTLYTIGRMKRVYKKALRIIRRDFDCSGNNCIFYSYWLNLPLPALLLKKRFEKHGSGKMLAISRGHGYDLYAERSAIKYLPFQKEYIRDLDFVFPCSENGAKYLNSHFMSFASKICVKRLGTTLFGTNPEGPKNPSDPYNFVTCSRLRKLKRLDIFAKAFALLKQSGLNATWSIIGDGEEEENLIRLCHNLQIESNIIRLGRLKNSEVINYYRNHHVDFLINTSEYEGVPVSIMEALSFGIPCIATNVGGTGEILSNECGALVDADVTPEQLSEIILSLIQSKDYLSRRKKAKQYWLSNCSADKNYTDWANTLFNLLVNPEL